MDYSNLTTQEIANIKEDVMHELEGYLKLPLCHIHCKSLPKVILDLDRKLCACNRELIRRQ